MSKLKKVLVHIIRDLALGLIAALLVGAVFYFVAMPRLRDLIQNVGQPIPANNQRQAIQTNQSSEKK